jgi:hypothetical protein
MADTAPVIFTLEELWLLRSVVRHEIPSQETWKFPPASLHLNDQIAETILLCHENQLEEAALMLSRGDTLIIDYVVPQDAKSAKGVPLGVPVLLKSFRARKELAEGEQRLSQREEPVRPSDEQIQAALTRADRLEKQRARRAARRKARDA